MKRRLLVCRSVASVIAICVGLWAQRALACPTCKDSLTENYVAAYGYSIVFMMSMPFLIFGSLAAYFYYEVRKARASQPRNVGQVTRLARVEE